MNADEQSFTFHRAGTALFTIKPDGSIERGPGFTTNEEAALTFWECVAETRAQFARPARLTFADFSHRNRERCESPTGFRHVMSDWSLSDWMTATLGELGEAANIVKKLNRMRDGVPGNGDVTADALKLMLADEIADTFIYLDLMAQAAGFDLETIVTAKFDMTSKKIGYGA